MKIGSRHPVSSAMNNRQLSSSYLECSRLLLFCCCCSFSFMIENVRSAKSLNILSSTYIYIIIFLLWFVLSENIIKMCVLCFEQMFQLKYVQNRHDRKRDEFNVVFFVLLLQPLALFSFCFCFFFGMTRNSASTYKLL